MNGKSFKHTKNRHNTRRNYWVLASIIIILLFSVAVRYRLLNAPLDRSEGAYAHMGQLILKGIPPYVGAYDIKMPGLYAIYALIMAIFGQSVKGIHFGLLAVNAVTITLLFLAAKELFGNWAGVASAAFYALFSLSQPVHGLFASAEHFIVLAAIGGIVLLMQAVKSESSIEMLLSGFVFGISFIIEHRGGFFILFGGLYILCKALQSQSMVLKSALLKCCLFFLGAGLPFALACFILWKLKAFDQFWFWTYTYPKGLSSHISLYQGLRLIKHNIFPIINQGILLWVLAGNGLISLVWNKKVRGHLIFILLFLFLSFLSICPGLYFEPQYFILLLPALSLLTGVGIHSLAELFLKGQPTLLKKVLPPFLAIFVLFQSPIKQRFYLFKLSPQQVSRMTFRNSPFSESLKIAAYITNHSAKNDMIAVLGSEPQIYFYSKRRPATRYIVAYPMMAKHKFVTVMQEEMIKEIESARPKFLIFVAISTSWMAKEDSDKMIFNWFSQYQQKYYKRIGIIDLISEENTVYYWGDESLGYYPGSTSWIDVFERLD